MALRRLAIVGSVSTPISRLASPNRHVISTRRPISDFLRRHHFSASADESASKVASINSGFGFFVDDLGGMVKKPQILKALIGHNVEIGANTCIDRGSWRDTVIGDHAKIDNLVQIGHNVVIGKYSMLCGQVGIAGSVTIGDYVTLGGRVAVRDHVSIASKVRLAANSCVTKDINVPGDYGGFPAVPVHEWRRQIAALRRTLK